MRHPAILLSLAAAAAVTAAPLVKPGTKALPLPGEAFQLDGHDAFIIRPKEAHPGKPWVWYAPTLRGLPSKAETWMFQQLLAKGIAIAGIDVGESYGSPTGRKIYEQFHDLLVTELKFSPTPVLLARSRGGLMLYSWAAEHPESVGAVAGIYPVCNIASYPGVKRAAGAYQMTPGELEKQLTTFNPIDRLAGLAQARVPIRHIHGDADKVVPLEHNSSELAKRYQALGGPIELEVVPGQGHNMWTGWFQSQPLTDFIIAHAIPDTPAPENLVPGKPGLTVALTGTLQGGIMAIGGETTGWRLSYTTKDGPRSIEIDMSAIRDAGKFDGKQVTISGTTVMKKYVTRGEVLIVKATACARS